MQGNRSRDTAPEWAVRRLIHKAGLRYRVAVRPIKSLRRRADIVFPKERIAVFVDGCFWHACPEHFVAPKTHAEYWEPKIERNRLRDVNTNRVLADAGWTVLRFWAHEPPEQVAKSVIAAVQRVRKRRL